MASTRRGLSASLSTFRTVVARTPTAAKENFSELALSKGKPLEKVVNGVLERYEVGDIALTILVPIENIGKPFIASLKDKIETLHPNLKGKVVIQTAESILGL